jgi:RHS repeat-associated protein
MTNAKGHTTTYTYDGANRLTKVRDPLGNERTFVYDHAGNRVTRTDGIGRGTTYTYDDANRLTQTSYDNATSVVRTLDANGNLTALGDGTFDTAGYDDENRLVWAQADDFWRSEFAYDGLGRLRQRSEYDWDGYWKLTEQTTYIYDGWRVVQERNGTNNTPTVSYTRGNDLSGTMEGAGGIGGLLARSSFYSYYTPGDWALHFYYFADGNGNITYMLDASQAMAASYRYDPFGNTISLSGVLAGYNVYRFSSKEIMGNSGLYYFGYRFYAPNLERWLNRDPIGEVESGNLYAFVRNNPIERADPFGLFDGQTTPGHPWPIHPPPVPPTTKTCGVLVTRATFPSDKCYRCIDNVATMVFAPHEFLILSDGTRLTNGGDSGNEDHWTAEKYPIFIPIAMSCSEFSKCVKNYMASVNSKPYNTFKNNCHAANDAVKSCGGRAIP